MITSEQITEIVNAVKQAWHPQLMVYKNALDQYVKETGNMISNLQYDIKQLLVHQTALTDKLHYLQLRMDNSGAEPNQHDALGEHSADKILSNPVMDRQEYPEGMREAKEWEIVEFHNYTRMSDGRFALSDEPKYHRFTAEYLLLSDAHIHSVRRLSDGEVFTVVDNTVDGPIEAFDLRGSRMYVQYRSAIWGKLSDAAKAPSFTTADGVEVLEGYNIWYMNPEDGPVPTWCKAEKGLNWDNHYSTKEAAEVAYKAAVLFTTADGVAIFNEETEVWSWNDMNIFSWQLKYLLDPARPWYSTHAAAESAYNKWLYDQPVLTLALVKATAHLSAVELVELEQTVKNKIANP